MSKGPVQINVDGIVVVYFCARPIAIITSGGFMWRDPDYPLDLIEFIVNYPKHENAIWN